ncbi:VCBS domain-containing protein, partial [Rhodobacteraceae bacterium KMM 6894]|nr:VCBS domain-containing protein [Rhodobacteraceae bacterium KMM 6894]
GATVDQVVTITVTGTNDTPAISGTATGAVTEDTTLTTTGQLAVADVDTTDTHTWSVPTPAGSYGSLAIDTDGLWTYT